MDEFVYTIVWTTTETISHRATVDAATMATMIGTDVATLTASGDDVDAIDGRRGLENGLADIEDSDTEDGHFECEREVHSVSVARRTSAMMVHID